MASTVTRPNPAIELLAEELKLERQRNEVLRNTVTELREKLNRISKICNSGG